MKRTINATLALALAFGLGLMFTTDVVAQEQGFGKAKQQMQRGANFIDEDGDGICDRLVTPSGNELKHRFGPQHKGYGPGDGTGNRGVGPRDGSGFGPGGSSGNCDGTGPKGAMRRGGR